MVDSKIPCAKRRRFASGRLSLWLSDLDEYALLLLLTDSSGVLISSVLVPARPNPKSGFVGSKGVDRTAVEGGEVVDEKEYGTDESIDVLCGMLSLKGNPRSGSPRL